MDKNKKIIELAMPVLAAFAAAVIATTAQAQSSVAKPALFADDLTRTTASATHSSISFEPKAMAMLANVDITAKTGSVLSARIRHHYLPRQPKVYAMPAKNGPVRAITDEDLQVRVVYASFLPDEDPIDFTAD